MRKSREVRVGTEAEQQRLAEVILGTDWNKELEELLSNSEYAKKFWAEFVEWNDKVSWNKLPLKSKIWIKCERFWKTLKRYLNKNFI